MMRIQKIKRKSIILMMLAVGGLACRVTPSAPATPTDTPLPSVTPTTLPTPTEQPTPTDTAIPASPTPDQLAIATPKPGTVVLDFVALLCNAWWANGSHELPCPGNQDDLNQGYIASDDHANAEGGIPINAPLLIGLPGQGGIYGAGLFGRYPPLLIQNGDTFSATMSCLDNHRCSVQFALEYYDTNGKYHDEMHWSWRHAYGGGPFHAEADLSPLAGQTVDLTLVVRDEKQPQTDWVLWMNPVVTRHSAQ